MNCKEDVLHGVVKRHRKDGLLLERKHYKNGVLEGEYKSYWMDGSVHNEGTYKNGIRIGKWTKYVFDSSRYKQIEYDDNGAYIRRKWFKNGMKITRDQYYQG